MTYFSRGILIQYFIQYGASFADGGPKAPNQGTAAFRIPWGIQIVPGAILFVGMFFLPRSPRWLASKDRWEEALQVLANLHGSGDINHPKVLAEYHEIEEALRFEREEAVSSFKALVAPRMLKRVILGMSIQMWSQLCGMNIMMYYIVYIMEAAGVGSPLLTASIQYIINVALTLPAILYLDRFGRRPALLAGSFLMMTWLFISGSVQGAYGAPNPRTDPTLDDISWVLMGNPAASKAVIACSYLFVASFATTWGPTSWVSLLTTNSSAFANSELSSRPTRLRSTLPRSVLRLSRFRPPPTGPGTAFSPSPFPRSSGPSTGRCKPFLHPDLPLLSS